MKPDDKERWRWIVGWRGYYLVSSHGRIKSVARMVQGSNGVSQRIKARFLRPNGGKFGHLQVQLWKDGESKTMSVHQLVLEAFVGPCPTGMEVRHFPDRNPANNHLDNLRYGTPKDNAADRVIHGTASQGERHYKAKLTEHNIQHIRQLCAEKKQTLTEIASLFGVSADTISNIRSRKTWRHVG